MRQAVNFTTKGQALTSSVVDLLANSATSESIYRVVGLKVANIHASNTVTVTVAFYDATTATSFSYVNLFSMATGTSTELISNAPIYLQAGDKLTVTCSANASTVCAVSYEELANV